MKTGLRTFVGFVLIIVLLIALFSYAMFQGGFVSWFLFFSFFPIGIYLISLSLYPISNWKITRELSRSVVQAGEKITVTITARRLVPYPLAYCLLEDMLRTGFKEDPCDNKKAQLMKEPLHMKETGKTLLFPWFQRTIHYTYEIDAVTRGEHYFTHLYVETGDLFGFIQKKHMRPLHDELIVYPRKRAIRIKKVLNEEKDVSTSVFAKPSNDVRSSREYVPGDNLSWIDWKQTARKSKMMTKEFEREEKSGKHIILNASDYNGNALAFEAAVELAFSIINSKWNDPATFTTIGATTASFPVFKDADAQENIARHLTSLQPRGNQFSLVFKVTLIQQKRTSINILITPRLDKQMAETIVQMIQQLYSITVIFVRFEKTTSVAEQELIHMLRKRQANVYTVSEKQWRKKVIEVNA
ncbi:DUF58 domain-containing protein [Virgibacillus sp. W0181]|uniref:DUF58 domain-containing protein n=1 Tax=Virgibacillus sp. W0181 TaxID=3391581 RepID=UPI003F476BD1